MVGVLCPTPNLTLLFLIPHVAEREDYNPTATPTLNTLRETHCTILSVSGGEKSSCRVTRSISGFGVQGFNPKVDILKDILLLMTFNCH